MADTFYLNTGSTFASVGATNPLNNYSSYNYVFTLAALTQDEFNSTSYLAKSPQLEHVIFKTSGKGTKGITDKELFNYNSVPTASGDADAQDGGFYGTKISKNDELKQLVDEFNKNGTGRFDLFVESLEMNGPWKLTEGAVVTQIQMTVIEPLSMNGFLESLRVNCLAAGYESHVGVPLCLKIEFWGWNDTTGKAEKVPRSERYWTVGLNNVQITSDERGTSYRCGFVNMNANVLGMDADVPVTLKMKGKKIGDMLTSLLKEVEDAKKKGNDSEGAKVFNSYEIKFEPVKAPDGSSETFTIEDKEINDFLRANNMFEYAAPTDKTKKNNYKFVDDKVTAVKYDPAGGTISVRSGTKIFDIIDAVIRDSAYTKDFIDNKDKWKDKYKGKVPWYRIHVTTKVKDKVNPKEERPAYTITYTVRAYWIHYSRLPEEFGSWDPEGIRKTLSRTYNYIYTGKNVDLLDFRISFNSLYLQERPYKLGVQDRSATSLGASPSNTVQVKAGDQEKKNPNLQVNTAPAIAGSTNKGGLDGKPIQISPYLQLAQAIQNQLLDNNEMQGMTCKIIGDPYYLVTGGMSNVEYELENETQTKGGEAPWLDGEIYISIDFKNPRDYRADGFMDFGGETIDHFSGIFGVRSIDHHFRDGEFTQTLNLWRLAGQQPSKKVTPSIPFKATPEPGQQQTKDSAPASVNKYGAKKAVADINKILNPQIPSLGAIGFMNSLNGLYNRATNTLQSSVARLDAAAAETLGAVQGLLAPVQTLATVGMQIGGLVAVADALLNNPGAPAVGQSLTGYNPYTNGIPLQTTTIPAPSSNAQNQANQSAQANIISSFVQDTNNLYTLETNYKNNVITSDGKNYITNPSSPSNLNNVGQKTIAALNGIPTDPTAIAAQLGIDPAQFSGLSADQQTSLLSRLQKVFATVPLDANIQGFQALGLSLKNITGAAIPKLPALQALTTAPIANVSQYDLQKILASGGNPANLPGATSFASVAAVLALFGGSRGQSGGTSGGNPLVVQQQIDKFSSASALNNASLNTAGLQPAVQGLGSVESNQANAVQTVQGFGGYYVQANTANSLYGTQRTLSPLDKLMLTKQS
jgi:hypothetical protein